MVLAAPSLRAAPPNAALIDRLQLLAQLRAGEYQDLEDRLVALQSAYEKGIGPEDSVEHAFYGFAVSAKDIEPRLSEWVRAFPRSYAALTARGFHYWRLAWLSRQGRSAKKTKAAQFRKMTRYFNRAKRDFKAALAINRRLTLAYGMLINIAVADGTAKERKMYLKGGLKADPASRITLFMYLFGLMPQWHGSLDAMRKFAAANNKRRETNPKIPRIDGYLYRSIARRHKRAGRVRRAIDDLTEGLKFGDHWRLYWERGDLYQRIGQHQKAVGDYTKALEIRPDEAEVLIDRAWSFKRLKRHDRASQDLDRAIRLDARIPRARMERARVNLRQKKFAAALRDLDAAMAFGSYNLDIVSARAYLHMGHKRDYRKAAKDLERATQLAPENQDYWYNLAVAYYYVNDCRTVEATNRYIALCSSRSGKSCGQHKVRQSIKIIHGFLKKHKQCKAKPPPLPPEPTLFLRLWERFKSGLVKTLSWMFLKPKSQ
jgi:tetratricopeptide (TPR) repeat protein